MGDEAHWRVTYAVDARGWITLTKLIGCKGNPVQTVISWQLRFWAEAQAGNRAGKTGHYQQWWDNESECLAVIPAVQKVHYSSLLVFVGFGGFVTFCCAHHSLFLVSLTSKN